MDYFIDAFRKYFDFKGVATRKQYWMFVLFTIIFAIPLVIIDALITDDLLISIYNLILFIPSISIIARRLHDIGRSGWWQLIALIPIIGIFILLYFLVKATNVESKFRLIEENTSAEPV